MFHMILFIILCITLVTSSNTFNVVTCILGFTEFVHAVVQHVFTYSVVLQRHHTWSTAALSRPVMVQSEFVCVRQPFCHMAGVPILVFRFGCIYEIEDLPITLSFVYYTSSGALGA